MVYLELIPEGILTQIILLVTAFLLSAVIGIERQRHLKSAGLRTHTLVGLGAALFTLVSAYGFGTILGADVVLDPSRIAAQVVSGIGFLGAGVIFVKRNAVSGLTTAASIWVTAAIGMACGAGMPAIAACTTALHLTTVGVLTHLGRKIPRIDRDLIFVVEYREGKGILRLILGAATSLGYTASLTDTRKIESPGERSRIVAHMKFHNSNRHPLEDIVEALADIKGVVSVRVAKAEMD